MPRNGRQKGGANISAARAGDDQNFFLADFELPPDPFAGIR